MPGPSSPSSPAPVRVLSGVEVLHIYVSPGHNYFGHHGAEPGDHSMQELTEVRCLAGAGLEGDRFLSHKRDYKGQVTFLAEEVFRDVCRRGGWTGLDPSVARRNVVTRGVDLNELVGSEFELQGIRFLGCEECRPCEWMDRALGPGAEGLLRGRGGLRARILTDGTLRRTVPPPGSAHP